MIQRAAAAAAATTIQPVPLLDIAMITPIQVGMVHQIGRLRGYSLDRKSVLEVLRAVKGSLVTQNAIIASAKLVPAYGWLVACSTAYALTYALGEVADYYFRTGRRTPASELKRRFQEHYRRSRATRLHQMPTVRRELDDLTRAKQLGQMGEEEFTRKKQEILMRV